MNCDEGIQVFCCVVVVLDEIVVELGYLCLVDFCEWLGLVKLMI